MAAPPPSILSATSLPSSIPHGIYLGPALRHGVSTNNVAVNFWSDCLSFSIWATATIAITTTSLISDWLLLRLLRSISIPGYANFSIHSAPDSSLGMHLHPDPTGILYIIVIISTITYCFYFLWFLYMFSIQRSMLKDRWDGLPTKDNCLVKFGGEIFTFLMTVTQDIPVSTLLFVIQAAVSCELVIVTENVIFLLATCSTLISVIWKACQVFWNSGCCGYRYEYLSSKGLVALRLSTLLTLAAAFALATCNIVLLSGWQSQTISTRQLSSSVMDKVGVDRWWRGDYVNLVSCQSDPSANSSGPAQLESIVQVAPMHHILKPDQPQYLTLSVIPCQDHNYDFVPFLQIDHQHIDYTECTIYFQFHVRSETMKILYDFQYMLQKKDSCWTGTLQRFQQLKPGSSFYSANHSSSSADILAEHSDNEAPTATASSSAGTIYASQPSQQPFTFHSVLLNSYLWTDDRFSCQYELSRDTSLLATSNLCR